ncbi:spondin-1 isoform X2 [Daktulosphaira vitifoliae]|uniref:spondin-1 isoform X2 n=1 Tax=Daktulosphaira vitifoliae TaxID=58002 RepID=UPI0021AA99A7|nr:spondin-1 isoform X2 [Daktulosphaira vitifoliae]
MIRKLIISITLYLRLLLSLSALKTCDLRPNGITAPKSTNPHPFRIVFKGNTETYWPGTTYTIMIQSVKTSQTMTPSFSGFTLTVEAEDHQTYDEDNEFFAGTFQLAGDVKTKISEVCPNTITQTSMISKSEVQVFWVAPPSGSGCIIFKAIIVEYRDIWYSDDDQLSKKICEENNESNDENSNVVYECCACDEAKFELTFEGMWSRHTHPKDYPDDNWQTRFSDVIGASHKYDYRFWEQGHVASEGMNSIARNGATSTLESELKSQSDKIRTIIKARGISYPNITGKTFAVFRVDQEHHLVSVVSFMYPSPDWFVGISGLELCLPNCNWITNKTINLFPWDAGIDSGVTYNASDYPTVPRTTVQRVWVAMPNESRSPFYTEDGMPIKPIARLHLTRQRLYEKSCVVENSKTESNACAVGPWSEWEPCTATCGRGNTSRHRQYLNPDSYKTSFCSVQLTQNKKCYVLPSCSTDNEQTLKTDSRCDTTAFGRWSNCSAECGVGVHARFRTILNIDVSPKYCFAQGVQLEQTVDCMVKSCTDDSGGSDLEVLCKNCWLSNWSMWSPCSTSCGQGQRQRNRVSMGQSNDCLPQCFLQTIDCPDNPSCDEQNFEDAWPINNDEIIKRYNVTVQRLYYYSKENKISCNSSYVKPFTPSSQENTPVPTFNNNLEEDTEDGLNESGCRMSKWGKFSNCSVPCGLGKKHRTRQIIYPTNPMDQKKCRKKLIDQRSCRGKQCKCRYSEWTEWSLCSAPCGMNAFQQRTRIPEDPTQSWCSDRLQQRICAALACKSN